MPWVDVHMFVDVLANLIAHQLVLGDGQSDDAIRVVDLVILVVEAV